MTLLELLIVLIILMWVFGYLVMPMGGSLIHVLLVIVCVLIVVRLLQGRPVG